MADDAKKKSRWTCDWETGRLSVTFPSGRTASEVLMWAKTVPVDLRPVAEYGAKQMCSDAGATDKDTPAEVREGYIREKLAAVARGDFGDFLSTSLIYEALILLKVAKDATGAEKAWLAETEAKRKAAMETAPFKAAVNAAKKARAEAAAKKALAEIGKGFTF